MATAAAVPEERGHCCVRGTQPLIFERNMANAMEKECSHSNVKVAQSLLCERNPKGMQILTEGRAPQTPNVENAAHVD